jgi:hypothetical protein
MNKGKTVLLGEIAYARSGDKGSNANIGVIARDEASYVLLKESLTAEKVRAFFEKLDLHDVKRFDLPNLGAFNFVLEGALAGGGSRSLRCDAQGKALGQAILEMPIVIPEDL